MRSGEGEDATFEEVELRKVTLTMPKGKVMREIMRLVHRSQVDPENYSEPEMVLDATQAMSDMPPGGIDELHPSDISAMGEKIAPFLIQAMGSAPSSQSSPDGTATTNTK